MTLTEFIQSQQNKMFPFQMHGSPIARLKFFDIMAQTEIEETDPNWWALRMYGRMN